MSRRKYSNLDWTEIGARVRSERERLNLSQPDLADLCHLKHKTSISKIEAGIQSLSVQELVIMAGVFGRTLGWLITGRRTEDVKFQVGEKEVPYGKQSPWQRSLARDLDELIDLDDERSLRSLARAMKDQIELAKQRKSRKMGDK